MKKIYLALSGNRYWIEPSEFLTNNTNLYNFHLALDPIEDLEVDVTKKDNKVVIWSLDSFKEELKDDVFVSKAEQNLYNKAYEKYYDKRWDEMPKIEMSLEDYETLKQKFENIKKEKPKFIVFILDDSGLLDKVELIGKNELSEQDLQDIKIEHEQYLRWQKAKQIYNDDHDIIDDIWRSPADSVYDADIEKYLDREVGFVEHQKYTKQQIIEKLKEKLNKKEPVYLIIHWLYIQRGNGIEGADESFEELLQQFGYMDLGWEKMISHEELEKIADILMAGKDVKL